MCNDDLFIKDIYVCSQGKNTVKMHLQQIFSGVKKILINNFNFPVSYYFINSSNNTFICHYNGADETITLTPNRNYDANDLASELQTQLNSIGGSNWTVTFDQNTLKFTFSDSNNVNKNFNFTNNPFAKLYLGFANNVTSVFDDTAPLISDNVVQLSHDVLYLRSNGIINNNIDINGNFCNIIADIPIFNNFDTHNFYRVEFSEIKNLVYNSFNYLEFYVTDKFGNNIDLNGASYSFKLTIHYSVN